MAPEPGDVCDVCKKGFRPGAVAVANDNRGWIDGTGRFRHRWRHQHCHQAATAFPVM